MPASPVEPTADQTLPEPRRNASVSQREAALRELLAQGNAAAQRGRRERAQRCFEAVLNEDPGNEEAWLGLARLTEDRALARAMYERASEFCPQSARLRAALQALDETAASAVPPSVAAVTAWPTETAAPVPLGACTPPAAADPVPAAAALQGAALFVPPWEINTPLPFGPGQSVTATALVAAGGIPSLTTPLALPGEMPTDEGAEAISPQSQAAVDPAPGEEMVESCSVGGVARAEAGAVTEEPPAAEGGLAATEGATPPVPIPEKELAREAMPNDAPLPPVEQAPPPIAAAEAPAPRPAPPPAHRRSSRDVAMLLMLAFVLLGAVLMLILAGRDSRADAVRSALGMVTETPTATATLLPTETPTRLPTLTASPTLAAPAITATVAITLTPVLTTTLPFNPTPSWVTARYAPLPLEEKWIEVNLTTQTLIAYEGTKVVFKTKISSGRKNTPTLEGKWRIREKLESQLMSGPGYYLPGVPYVMYFVGSYALHGAYWHNNWGTPMSHGCVNLKREDARWLYGWTGPVVPKGAKSVVSTAANPGTWVLVHK